jgi:osmotically-inducible protein OsmY
MGLLGQIDGGRGFGEELMSDQSLQQVVLSGLFAEPRINATYIEVTASEGIVRLAGHVERHLEKWLAKLTAAHVSGVRAVTEEIEVRFPRSHRATNTRPRWPRGCICRFRFCPMRSLC